MLTTLDILIIFSPENLEVKTFNLHTLKKTIQLAATCCGLTADPLAQ